MNREHILHILDNPGLHYNAHKILIELALVRTFEGFCAQSISSLMDKTLLSRMEIQNEINTLRRKRILKLRRIHIPGSSRYIIYYKFIKKKEGILTPIELLSVSSQ